jgi:hydrogenase expression/formation protein HypC
MCLAIPAKIMEINDDIAKVDFGGTVKEVNLSLVNADLGDYVIVHAGFAIEILDEKDALDTLEMFQQILELEVE